MSENSCEHASEVCCYLLAKFLGDLFVAILVWTLDPSSFGSRVHINEEILSRGRGSGSLSRILSRGSGSQSLHKVL